MSENKPGRPRVYASDTDRVRAWRARQKEGAAGAAVETPGPPADPGEAAATLAQVLPLLAQEAEAARVRLSAVADQITKSVDLLVDPAAVDAHLRRAQVTAAKVRADAAAEIEQLRDQLDTALDDRVNADAAAQAAEAAAEEAATALVDAQQQHVEQVQALAAAHQEELTALTAEHTAVLNRWQQQMETADAEHREKIAEQHQLVESLRTRNTDLGNEIAQIRGESDRAAAASAATIDRLETDLDEARTATASERTRVDEIRDELATTKADLATAQAQAAAARERAEELRADLTEARGRTTTTRKKSET